MMDAKCESGAAAPASGSWWSLLDCYQKEVFVLATLSWMFDCLGQQVFVIARNPALLALMPPGTQSRTITEWGGYMTSIFMLAGPRAA